MPRVAGLVLAVAFGIGAAAAPVAAQPPFAWPIDCVHGEDCWIVRHVDRDPGPAAVDVACGALTGEDHRGTDIALADLAELARGVAVLAPAAGRVAGVRDGMPDVARDAPGAPDVEGRECGNGVRLDHGGGWTSQLCHLRRDSVRVRPGDLVAKGAVVGLVGLSGSTTFPHLHVSFERDGRLVDAMDGMAVAEGAPCGGTVAPLFEPAPAYITLPLVGAGVAVNAPEDADLLRGWHRERNLPPTAPALVIWAHAYGTAPGDELDFRIDGPTGATVLAHRRELDDGHARGSYFAGARRPDGDWPTGLYEASITWRRGDVVAARRFTFEVTPDAPDR